MEYWSINALKSISLDQHNKALVENSLSKLLVQTLHSELSYQGTNSKEQRNLLSTMILL